MEENKTQIDLGSGTGLTNATVVVTRSWPIEILLFI
jgi:hypothetical protein